MVELELELGHQKLKINFRLWRVSGIFVLFLLLNFPCHSSLLKGMGQLMGQQLSACAGSGIVLSLVEINIVADRKSFRAFSFMDVEGEAEEPGERIDLANLAQGDRS